MRFLIGYDLLLELFTVEDCESRIAYIVDQILRLGHEPCIDFGTFSFYYGLYSESIIPKLRGFRLIRKLVPKTPLQTILNEQTLPYQHLGFNPNLLLLQTNLLQHGLADFYITDLPFQQNHSISFELYSRIFDAEDFLIRCSIAKNNQKNAITIKESSLKDVGYESKFLDSFREDYMPYYEYWFCKKAEDPVYIAFDENDNVCGLLKLKIENQDEDYSDINPTFRPKKRLKISAMKVSAKGVGIGSKFIQIIFEKAINENVDEIYVTIKVNNSEKRRLVYLLESWGFHEHGTKGDTESVYVRPMKSEASKMEVSQYPFIKASQEAFSSNVGYAVDFENTRQSAILSLPLAKKPSYGDVYFAWKDSKVNNGIDLSIGIVESIKQNFKSKEEFIQMAIKRSTLRRDQLELAWSSTHSPSIMHYLSCRTIPNITKDKFLHYVNVSDSKPHLLLPVSRDNKIYLLNKYASDIVIN